MPHTQVSYIAVEAGNVQAALVGVAERGAGVLQASAAAAAEAQVGSPPPPPPPYLYVMGAAARRMHTGLQICRHPQAFISFIIMP